MHAVQACLFGALWLAEPVAGATLAEKARESGCVGKPVPISGALYKCATATGADSFFNVPGDDGAGRRPSSVSGSTSARSIPSPAGFPRVDPDTQKNRDDVRRKVLNDELAAETKLLADARVQYQDGAPVPLPEERADAEKYRVRIGRLRQAVAIHEKNVEALKKELATIK